MTRRSPSGLASWRRPGSRTWSSATSCSTSHRSGRSSAARTRASPPSSRSGANRRIDAVRRVRRLGRDALMVTGARAVARSRRGSGVRSRRHARRLRRSAASIPAASAASTTRSSSTARSSAVPSTRPHARPRPARRMLGARPRGRRGRRRRPARMNDPMLLRPAVSCSRYDTTPVLRGVSSTCRRTGSSGSSDRTAPARRRCSACSPARGSRQRGRVSLDGTAAREAAARRPRAAHGGRAAGNAARRSTTPCSRSR